MSMRLSHTWVITARLTHSYMYAGYRFGGGGGGGGGEGGSLASTVEPLYNGHIGAGQFVRYKEVSFIGRLVQECICNPYKVLL